MSEIRDAIRRLVEEEAAESATGCPGAGDYARWAREKGYPYCETVDWSSSAGDWTFIVSQDGEEWHIMSQENNWPRAGFTRSIAPAYFLGTAEEVLQEIFDRYA